MKPSINKYAIKITISAQDFYQQLIEGCSSERPLNHRIQALRDVFRRVVEQYISSSTLNFVGMFAKTDYVVRQCAVPADAVRLIHSSRNKLFSRNTSYSESDFPHDLKAVCILVFYVCGNVSIPDSLRILFPTSERTTSWGGFDRDCIRVIVKEWDEHHIIAVEEHGGDSLMIRYDSSNSFLSRNGKFSWDYLSDILSDGCQLNLVRVRIVDGTLFPELIIYEPDYLVNITTVASCFESYAESPLVSLIGKLRPVANTMPIHLGNLAGQYLDDAVHGRDIPFADGFIDFFHRNALSLVSCPEFFDADSVREFYANAQQQHRNIHQQLNSQLPQFFRSSVTFDSSRPFRDGEVVLEPSFYSSVLGIQGRMDFLISNDSKTVIIEQKSGKADFPFAAKEPHLVQLMLYRALLTYQLHAWFTTSKDEAFLLMYSRYPQGLISTAQMPELMLRALRIRNLIAYNEMRYAEEGFGILEQLTPDSLNEKHLQGKLWDNYIRPQLYALLSPIHSCSDLERTYFMRFMRFLAKEHLLAKVGNKTKDCSGFASIWQDKLADKRLAGNIYDSLRIDGFSANGDAVSMVRLAFDNINDNEYALNANFRIGDIVILYPYFDSTEPYACSEIVHRATITNITNEHIELKLRNPQTGSSVFSQTKESLWAIEHDLMETTDSALYRAMHSFLNASSCRRDIILCQRSLERDESVALRGDYGQFNDLVLQSRQAKDMFFVIGPPGTGKTSHGLVNILTEELLDPSGSVLLLSYTNRAVDEICSKLVEHSIDFVRIGSEASCLAEYRDYLLPNRIAELRKGTEVRDFIQQQRVFCATTASLNGSLSLLSLRSFSLAIIDEASQILEPHLIAILSAHNNTGEDAISRFVFIGDHKQLPAVVQQTAQESVVTEPELIAIGLTDCRRSLFERLLSVHSSKSDADHFIYLLTHQGRMHRDIADFPNRAFYDGKLDVVPLPHQLLPNDDGPRVTFIPCVPSGGYVVSDKTNIVEAEAIARCVINIYEQNKDSFDVNQTIGVIVPYRNQISTIRNAIDNYGISCLHDIAIDTVERYQGSQRDYILYGFTVQRPYQLDFLTSTSFIENGVLIDRKLNVAMTRARLRLYLFGNPTLLSLIPLYKDLIDYTKK